LRPSTFVNLPFLCRHVLWNEEKVKGEGKLRDTGPVRPYNIVVKEGGGGERGKIKVWISPAFSIDFRKLPFDSFEEERKKGGVEGGKKEESVINLSSPLS